MLVLSLKVKCDPSISFTRSDYVIMVSVIIQQYYLFFSGVFFLPRDQQHDKPTKKTNYDGLAYLGGYALAWAACLGNETIYNILLEKV